MPWNSDIEGAALSIAGTDRSPLRVIAGPGTGKSFALKRRVARLLEQGANPRRILAVTFTRTAAANLVSDLCSLGIEGCDLIKASTLHSYCYSLLSKQSVFDYLDRKARPLMYFNKSGVMQFEGAPLLQDICAGGQFGGKRDGTKRIRAFEAAWARLQTDDPGWALDPVDQEFHDRLIAWLIFHEALLIGELIPLALHYLRDNPAGPERTSFDHVLVDEYQDLNRAEQVLIDLLCETSTQTLVGDPDQSIYSFRYAHPAGINEFGDTHPGTHDEALTECRRCPSTVVTVANSLISRNYYPTEVPRLQPFPGNPEGEIHIVQWPDITDEAQGLAEFCHYLIHRRGYRPDEILILTPRRLLGYSIRDALRELDITAHSFYHEELVDYPEAQEKVALLALLCSPEDRVAFRFLLGLESPSWNSGGYARIQEHCDQTGDSPVQTLERLADGSLQITRTNSLVNRFKKIQRQLGQLRPLRGYALLDGLFPPQNDWSEPVRDIALLHIDEETEATQFYDLIRAHLTQPEMPQEGDFIRVMSLHKSKGLTSRAVLVAGCIEGLVPTVDQNDTPQEARMTLEEQRRLFYVAITRCREILVLSSAIQLKKKIAYKIGARVQGNRKVGRTIASRFLRELGPTAPVAKIGASWVRDGFI